MHWFSLAIITAIALATADALSKKSLQNTEDAVIVWVREGYALPFLAVGFLFIPMPSLDAKFWLAVAALLPLEITALVLYVKAIRVSPLSLSVPFMALSPLFILFFAFIFLGETPSATGLAGIGLIVTGAYLLNASAGKEGALGPIRAAIREKGAVLMAIVSLIYAVTSTLGKVAVEHSSPVFFGFFYPFILTMIMTVYLASRGKLALVFSRPRKFVLIGLCTSIMIITHFLAISLAQVALVISVKRTSLIWSVLYGALLFKETNIRERLLGSAVMAAGVALIALS